MADATKKSNRTGKECKKAVRGTEPCPDGLKQMRLAADQWLGWNSDTIANALADKAVNGESTSARTLVSLALGEKPSAETMKKLQGLSQAQQLEAELQQGASEEDGSGEPENRATL